MRLIFLLLPVVLTTVGLRAAERKPAAADPTLLIKVGEYHLLHARQGAAAVAAGDNIYIFGGNAQGAITDVERFNPETHKVERLYDRFLPRRYHRAVEFEGRIYLFGGQGYGLPGSPLENGVEIYDIAGNSVTKGTNMPEARFSMAVARFGTKVYLIGGSKISRSGTAIVQTNETLIYDLRANTWAKGIPMPTPREADAVVVGNLILVPAGYRGSMQVDVVEFFNPDEGVWKTLPPLGQKTSAYSLAFLGNHLFFFGDYDRYDSVLAYDLRNRTTAKVAVGFHGARHTTSVVHRDVIYVIGGKTDSEGGEKDLIQAFTVRPDSPPQGR